MSDEERAIYEAGVRAGVEQERARLLERFRADERWIRANAAREEDYRTANLLGQHVARLARLVREAGPS